MFGAHPRTLSGSEEMRVFLGLVVQPVVAAGLAFVSSPLMEWSGHAIHGHLDGDLLHFAITQAFAASAGEHGRTTGIGRDARGPWVRDRSTGRCAGRRVARRAGR